MSFDRPLALLSLAVLAVLVCGYVLLSRRRPPYVVRYTNVDVLRDVAPRTSRLRRHAGVALLTIALVPLCIAVAGPHVDRSAPVDNATVVLVVDTSRSMLSTDVRPTRLDAAKAAAQTFLERAPERLRVGLVTFAGDVSVAASPTHDRERVRRSVAAIDQFASGGGTAIGDALARSVELARDTFSEPGTAVPATGPIPVRGAVTILFLSDGRQNRGLIQAEEGASIAADAEIPVFTVALGTDRAAGAVGSNRFGGYGGFARVPDRETLKAISERTGGEYFAARSARALESAYADLGSRLGRAKRPTEVSFVFVAAAAVALAGAAGLSLVRPSGLP
jgi:Ca-activated chloride channel family protein